MQKISVFYCSIFLVLLSSCIPTKNQIVKSGNFENPKNIDISEDQILTSRLPLRLNQVWSVNSKEVIYDDAKRYNYDNLKTTSFNFKVESNYQPEFRGGDVTQWSAKISSGNKKGLILASGYWAIFTIYVFDNLSDYPDIEQLSEINSTVHICHVSNWQAKDLQFIPQDYYNDGWAFFGTWKQYSEIGAQLLRSPTSCAVKRIQ